MATRVRLLGPPEADGEYVALRADGAATEEIVHLHDYARIYAIPGLYEQIVQELLECRSPQVAVAALTSALGQLRLDPADVVLLDLGAGTGLVGELVAPLGLGGVVALDLLPQARDATGPASTATTWSATSPTPRPTSSRSCNAIACEA
jgi:hypothetical protein